jgi:probable F420-dependent oxidoreductase
MQIGVVFPQTEIGPGPDGVRRYAQTVEQLGYAHIAAFEHVLGADTTVHQDWRGPYDLHTTFHEPFVLFGYLAGLVGLELVTSVVVLPQRQTALVAKQAAEVDLLAGGRFRLGVGVGWNAVEYGALGKDFTDRGRRETEQIELLRRLWTEESVTFAGRFETVTGAGLAPLPVQRPIPVWLGGASAPAYRRMGRLADGWFPQVPPGSRLDEARAVVAEAAVATGRDPASIGMEGRVRWESLAQVVDHIGRWRDAGASHVAINTMGASLATVDDHLRVLAEAAGALGLGGQASAARG